MTTVTGRLRRHFLLPAAEEVTFARRGFTARDSEKQSRLERTGGHFLIGFGHGLAENDLTVIERDLEGLERQFIGFAYEGAAMGLAVGDALSPLPRRLGQDFAAGAGRPHIYMLQVGVGWAMARLPRALWRRVVLDDPLLRWLALDGYGFHETYFSTPSVVGRRRPVRMRPPWPDPAGYAPHALDQGVGRALWFVCGADVDRLADTIEGFPADRRADLWSGAGLAATYAGGADLADLETLRRRAGAHAADLAQGSAFAAKARLLADLVTPDTEAAVGVFCGLGVAAAAAITDDTLADLPADGPELPAFEVWRRRIRAAVAGPAPQGSAPSGAVSAG